MILSGFTFARNAIIYDYPLKECIETLLALCDEVIIAVGDSEDETMTVVSSYANDKLRIISTRWDSSLGYKVLSEQTNLGLQQCKGKWGIYLQCDELIHEKYFKAVREAVEEADKNEAIEGLLFNYKHFYGSYRLYSCGRKYYRNEIRAIRLGIGVESYNDAKGFRRNGRKLIVKPVSAEVYHYGWARNPETMQQKTRDFHKLWHGTDEIAKVVSQQPGIYDLFCNYYLEEFADEHPVVMKGRVEQSIWSEKNYALFKESKCYADRWYKIRRLAAFLESKTWWIGYNKPYRLL
ncbi:MAG: hypothetical protein A2Y62_10085, partial [Candidatus Fischerbacteria bacterium RBG_13_37_8]